jgi:catechol 2,3-dioxygenase-like lactoylglutathione lyase family enzyme
MDIQHIDHLVLTVGDVERSVAFYTQVLGMQAVTYGNRTALEFGPHKINLHPAGSSIQPRAQAPQPGAADFCLLTSKPLAQVMEHLRACGVEVTAGPVPRIGAAGTIASVYFHDPDGNLIEVANVLDSSYSMPQAV